MPHYHHGKYWRLPENIGFPRGTARDLWRRWNIGDTVNDVPPLRSLEAKEFKFIRKIVNDMKTVCDFIESLAREAGVDCRQQALSETQCCEISSLDNGLISSSNTTVK